jgi:hypothetical protein
MLTRVMLMRGTRTRVMLMRVMCRTRPALDLLQTRLCV